MALTTSAQQILKSSSGDLGQLPEKYWELVELYRAELLNQAFAVVGNQADAEDVVQETLCEALVLAWTLVRPVQRMHRAVQRDFERLAPSLPDGRPDAQVQ